MPPLPDGHHGVIEFTGHAFVLTDRGRAEVMAQGAGGFGESSHPDVVRWLAGDDRTIGHHDAVLVARGTGGGSLPARDDLESHPRVQRSHRYRQDVRVHGDAAGFLTLGKGLVDRTEIAVQLFDGTPPAGGTGRRLIREGLALVDAGSLLWAQVAPGNAVSLRAFLACGFVPIGAETLLIRRASDPEGRMGRHAIGT